MSQPYHLRDQDHPEEQGVDEVVEIGHIKVDNLRYSDYVSSGKYLNSFATLTEDGRITINLDLSRKLPDLPTDHARNVKEFAVDYKGALDPGPPALNILILIVGSRGDVQPYLALGTRLKQHGHRVRLGTHETFRSFVEDAGLEFTSIGGDPQDLMSYMVKNPGLLPGFSSLTNGDIGRKRKMLGEMMAGCWKAAVGDDENGNHFAPDAIISNPPAFGHVHIAERLGVPLLLSFTMPWSPTTSFPHPLVNIKQSNAENGLTNYLSYGFADLLTWQGMGDVVNEFRTKTLGISPLSLRSGAGLVDRLKIPWTYCLSPALIPKPSDWKNHIDVVGFYFMDQATGYVPDPELAAFLDKGSKPVYIGFGSVVVEDSAKMTEIIFGAIKKAGVRALVSAGWGGLGGKTVPDDVFILGNVPHDWLFTKVSSVVHHGGAGTTAIALRLGKPTLIVPFFGDQPFWGSMVAKAGAGPDPIHHKALEIDNLAEAIAFCQTPQAQEAAEEMGRKIRSEDGVQAGVESFYRHLPLLNMRCDLDPTRVAVWYWNEQLLKLSAFAAQTLADAGKLDISKLSIHRSKEYETRKVSGDPLTGGVVEVLRTVTNYHVGIAQIFYNPVTGIINTTTAIPKGVVQIVGSVHEGFINLPSLYGSEVRRPGKIDNFSDGLKEAGKGFFYGYWDGIRGLVTEPMAGAKKEGFIGAVKGSARSFVNVTVKPAAGGLGLVVSPSKGIWASMTKKWTPEKERVTVSARRAEGVAPFKASSPADRSEIIAAYEKAKATWEERKTRLGIAAAEALAEPDIIGGGEDTTDGSRSETESLSTAVDKADAMRTPGTADHLSPKPSSTNPTAPTAGNSEDEFERDMELAKRLSIAEQEGYERGRADARK